MSNPQTMRDKDKDKKTERKMQDSRTKKTNEQQVDEITLKWGTLKAWNPKSDAAKDLLQKYFDIGSSLSAALQKDTDEQKQILVDLVSLPNMKIYLDWDGKYVTREEAIKYITEYK